MAFGIGQVANTLTGFGKVAFQTLAHAHLGGVMSVANGGSYGIGALSGGLGSLAASGMGSLLKNASNFWQGAGIIGSGAMMGGVSSTMAGGNFWDGFRNGAISSSLNHAMHGYADKLQQKITIKSLLRNAGYGTGHTPNDIPTYTKEYLSQMVEDIPYLAEKLAEAGNPDYDWDKSMYEYNGEFDGKQIWLSTHNLDSNFSLLSTFLHETHHAWQYYSGYAKIIENQFGKIEMGNFRNFGNIMLEINAHGYIKYLEGNHSFGKYWKQYQNLMNN
jgi:hypothetical protein